MKLLALTGPAGSGKDSVADYLVKHRGFVKLSFAAKMKDGIKTMMGWDDKMITDRELKETPISGLGKSPREMMQTIATDWGRDMVHPDIWLHAVGKEIDAVFRHSDFGKPKGIVISDMRFNNEADWIRKRGGSVVHIRPENSKTISASGHVSELGVTVVANDWNIVNNHHMGLHHLHRLIHALLKNMDRPAPATAGQPLNTPIPIKSHSRVNRSIHSLSISGLQKEIAEWADEVFPDRTAHNAVCKLMLEEIPELMQSKSMDPMEFADVLILILDIAHLQDIDIEAAVLSKMALNRTREWAVCSESGLLSHVKEPVDAV